MTATETATDEPRQLRLIALDRAVGLASTGRIDASDIVTTAREFEEYLRLPSDPDLIRKFVDHEIAHRAATASSRP